MTHDPDEVSLKLPGFGRLPDPAKLKLLDVLSQHASEIMDEASRLESRWRTDENGEPEITSRDIADAAVVARRSPNKRRSVKAKNCEVIAFGAAFIGGVFGNSITTPVGAVGFAVCALVGVTAYTNRGDG